MVSPDEEREDRNRHRRESDVGVTKNPFVTVDGDQLTDDTHRRHDHDVDRRVTVKPEEVLEEHRVATISWIEDSDPESPFEDQ